MGLPAYTIQTYTSDDALPEEAVGLFGHEAQDAWRREVDRPMAVAIGVTADGHWLAGVFVLLETLETRGEAAEVERVASIRQLIVQPAHRGAGLAGRLLRRVMTLATDAGCARVRSTAGFGCPDHLQMYHRLKFARAAGDERPYLVTRDLATA